MGGELAMERGEVIVARQYFSIPGGYRRVPEGTWGNFARDKVDIVDKYSIRNVFTLLHIGGL